MQVKPSLVALGLVVVAVTAFGATPAPEPRVEVAVRRGDVGAVRITVTLVNEVVPCRAVWITPRLQREHGGPMWLDLHVRSGSGADVSVSEGVETVRQDVSAVDMHMLDCGGIAGQIIDFAAPMTEWPFNLKRGKYSVQACVTSKLTEFVAEHPEWAKTFSETKTNSKVRQAAVRDFMSCSAWTPLNVK